MRKIPTSPKSLLTMTIKELLRLSANDVIKMNDIREALTSREATEAVYKKLARESDKRLRALEKLSEKEGFENVKKFAYARAQEDIKLNRGKGHKRYGLNPPYRESEMLDEIMDMKNFLQSKSSTEEGIRDTYMKTAETLNNRYGTDFKWSDMATFFESRFFKKMDVMGYDSKQIVKAIGVMQQDPEKFLKMIKESVKEDIKLPAEEGKEMQNRLIEDLINEYGVSLSKYLKKVK